MLEQVTCNTMRLKELNSIVPKDVPSQAEPQDQYEVERFALAD
jgi:hypothetical protein